MTRRDRGGLAQGRHKFTVEPKVGCWIEDPDGNRIEFMQMSPQSMQAEAISRLNKR